MNYTLQPPSNDATAKAPIKKKWVTPEAPSWRFGQSSRNVGNGIDSADTVGGYHGVPVWVTNNRGNVSVRAKVAEMNKQKANVEPRESKVGQISSKLASYDIDCKREAAPVEKEGGPVTDELATLEGEILADPPAFYVDQKMAEAMKKIALLVKGGEFEVDEEKSQEPIDELATEEGEALEDPLLVIDSEVLHLMKQFALKLEGRGYTGHEEESPPVPFHEETPPIPIDELATEEGEVLEDSCLVVDSEVLLLMKQFALQLEGRGTVDEDEEPESPPVPCHEEKPPLIPIDELATQEGEMLEQPSLVVDSSVLQFMKEFALQMHGGQPDSDEDKEAESPPQPIHEETPPIPIDELATQDGEMLEEPPLVVDSSVMKFMRNFALQMQIQAIGADEEAESLQPLPVDEEMPPIDELATLEEETLDNPTFVVDSSVKQFMKNFALQMQGQTYDTDEEAPPVDETSESEFASVDVKSTYDELDRVEKLPEEEVSGTSQSLSEQPAGEKIEETCDNGSTPLWAVFLLLSVMCAFAAAIIGAWVRM